MRTSPTVFSATFAFLLLFAVLAPISAAQTTAQGTAQAPVRDPQAIALVTASLNAMGAASVSSAQSDSRATGTLTMNANPPLVMNLTMETKGLTEKRDVLVQPNGTSVRVLQGGQGTLQKPDGTIMKLSLVNTLSEHVDYIPLFSILAEVQNPLADVEVVSLSTANGTPDNVISVGLGLSTDPRVAALQCKISRTLYYINAATGLVDQVIYTRYPEDVKGPEMQVREVFANYQTVNGVAVPFQESTYLEGQLESVVQLASVNLNVGVPESDFAVPGAAQ